MIQRFRNFSSILMPGASSCRWLPPPAAQAPAAPAAPARGPAAPTPPCGPGVTGKNIASDSRCFELRTYTVKGEGPGSIDLLHSRFRENTNRLFRKHGMTIVGFWQPLNAGMESTLIYLLAYKDASGPRRGVERIPNGSGMDEGRQGDAGGHRGPVGLHELDRLRADEIEPTPGLGIRDSGLPDGLVLVPIPNSRRVFHAAASALRAARPRLQRQTAAAHDDGHVV